jgi:restriction system protein
MATSDQEEDYHYPSDLLMLLIDTIPKLCRSKRDVLVFFRSCGVPRTLLADLDTQLETNPTSVFKAVQVRTVLIRLNEGGDRLLAPRREVIKRVVETEDFSVCWEADRLPARGLVAQVRERQEKQDAFTRMANERAAEAVARRQANRAVVEAAAKRDRELGALASELGALFQDPIPQRRGKALETVLNRYFVVEEVAVREAFEYKEGDGMGVLEQIDGVIAFEGDLYLVEVKWWADPLGPGDIALHMVHVQQRATARGLVISASPYTEATLEMCRKELQRGVFILAQLRELAIWMERRCSLTEMLQQKVRAAVLNRQPLHLTI